MTLSKTPDTDTDTVPARKTPLAAATLRALRATHPPADPPAPAELLSPGRADAPAGDNTSTESEAGTEAGTETEAAPADPPAPSDLLSPGRADTPASDNTSDEPEDESDGPPRLPAKRPVTKATRKPATKPATKAATPARRRPRTLVTVCAAVAVAALVFAVVAGVVWWRAGHSDARSAALARDKAVVDARLAITTVNTADYRHPATALRNWLAVSTGTLHSQFADSSTSATKLLAQAKMITSATVLDAAVTALDIAKGTATVIASVNVSRKPATGAATTTRNRFRASLKLVRGEWKLADLSIVSVALS